jgi:hypothetical protein
LADFGAPADTTLCLRIAQPADCPHLGATLIRTIPFPGKNR